MMLIILDKDPVKSAQLLPDKIKFKQLIELCQLICSAGISNVYKPIKQGKHLQNWILKNPIWTKKFAIALYELCKSINMSKRYHIAHFKYCCLLHVNYSSSKKKITKLFI